MSLNSLESEGLRPLHFLPFAHLAMSAQAGPGYQILTAHLAMVPGGEGSLYLLFHKKQLQSTKMCSERNGLESGGSFRQTTQGGLNIPKEESFLSRERGLAGWGVSNSRLCGPKKGSLHQDWFWHQILCQLVTLHLGLSLR